MNRIDRLLGTILLLQSRRVLTAEQIAAHFELSVRTVYRDLSALNEIGVPIAAEAGVGYSLSRGYHLPPVMFSEEEAVRVAMLYLEDVDAVVVARMPKNMDLRWLSCVDGKWRNDGNDGAPDLEAARNAGAVWRDWTGTAGEDRT